MALSDAGNADAYTRKMRDKGVQVSSLEDQLIGTLSAAFTEGCRFGVSQLGSPELDEGAVASVEYSAVAVEGLVIVDSRHPQVAAIQLDSLSQVFYYEVDLS